jgi:hypothetical protein
MKMDFIVNVKSMTYRGISAILLLALVFLPGTNVHASGTAQETPAEPYSELYVVYNHPEVQTFWIEIRDQNRDPGGSVSAHLYVRADSLIAYNLQFSSTSEDGKYLEGIDFLPLYPGRTYDIGRITINNGEHLEISGTKFGLGDETVMQKMTMVQIAILFIHLVGATPPTNIQEGISELPDAFDDVFLGRIGAIAGFIKTVQEIFSSRNASPETLLDVGETVASTDKGADVIADLVNIFTKPAGIRYHRTLIKSIFTAINIFQYGENVMRSVNAFGQLKNYPDYLTATISIAPRLVQPPSRYRVFELNDLYSVNLSFENLSGGIWRSTEDYQLWVSMDEIPFEKIDLITDIEPAGIATWNFESNAPGIPGIYHISYQMALEGFPIGPKIPAEIVVIPQKSGSLRDIINGLVEDYIQKAGDRFNDYIRELEAKIINAILKDILDRLSQICGGSGMVAILGITLYRRQKRRRKVDK